MKQTKQPGVYVYSNEGAMQYTSIVVAKANTEIGVPADWKPDDGTGAGTYTFIEATLVGFTITEPK